ncbi:MAG: 16S rRNA (uracil(1498)-N(3))-methyltransferase, partial [Kiritimatiellae bacterium]|nr:16S rRNA (uracil(1498)-N(3))-methyltransferase [Kiritimatiellia bacterium]
RRGPEVVFSVFVGPEGDFSPDEMSALLSVATPASFGPTVLRAETAAMFGVAVLAGVLQDFEDKEV